MVVRQVGIIRGRRHRKLLAFINCLRGDWINHWPIGRMWEHTDRKLLGINLAIWANHLNSHVEFSINPFDRFDAAAKQSDVVY